ncbi:MAG: DUF5615 family PIN-like protein [Tepidiformaceae bacterium]
MFPVYLDENSQDAVLVSLLRRDGVDCLLSNDAGNEGLPDDAQLAFATEVARTIVIFDRVDFQRLHAAWMRSKRTHAGIIIVTSVWLSAPVLHGALMRLQRHRSTEDMRNAILFIGSTPTQEQL